jgi:high-affinity iron transporter
MLPTFVIGLREGLEASLIVGIVAAFVRRERPSAMPYLWAGVAAGIGLCTAAGVALHLAEQALPQRQQEGLETVVGLLAVAMVTYMVWWMRRHSRELKGDLEGKAAGALATGGTWTLIAMAFLAVLREGLETVVFLLAAFQASTSPMAAGFGALLGVVVAVALGYGIYRGGVRINMARFFRVTGLVLVLVAAGLVATAAHTAHEAGWLDSLQGQALDLTWLVHPGTVISALLTGMLGIQPRPTVGEVAGWLLYLVPIAVLVSWPRRAPAKAAPPPVEPATPVTA